MKIIIILIGVFLLFLMDVPILSNKNTSVLVTYFTLLIIGFSILVINAMDLAVPSPAIVIENIIELVMRR